jgi:hypothetical protein
MLIPFSSTSGELHPNTGAALRSLVAEASELPGVIGKSSIGPASVRSIMSAGKPWYAYDTAGTELMRLRIAERWLSPDAGKSLGAGILKIYLQRVYPAGEYEKLLNLTTGVNIVLEDVGDVPLDQSIMTVARITMPRVGSPRGKIMRYASQGIAQAGFATDIKDYIDRFALQQEAFENNYAHGTCTPYDFDTLTTEMREFIDQEKLLAATRA